MIIKCDGEQAIKLIRKSVACLRLGKTVPEDIPPGEHDSMGVVEAMIKSTRNQFKSFRSCLEDRLGRKIPGDAPILQWLVRWSNMTLSRYQVGRDGRTGN